MTGNHSLDTTWPRCKRNIEILGHVINLACLMLNMHARHNILDRVIKATKSVNVTKYKERKSPN